MLCPLGGATDWANLLFSTHARSCATERLSGARPCMDGKELICPVCNAMDTVEFSYIFVVLKWSFNSFTYIKYTESYVWIAALSKLFVYWMHCPVGWQNQTQLSHKVAPGSTWNLFRLIKHTLIEYSAVVIFDPPWSKLSYKPLLLSKPKSTSPLLPKMRENERAFLNVRFSGREVKRKRKQAIKNIHHVKRVLCWFARNYKKNIL